MADYAESWSFRNTKTGDVYPMRDEADAHEMAQRHCRRAPVEVIRTRSFDEVVAIYPVPTMAPLAPDQCSHRTEEDGQICGADNAKPWGKCPDHDRGESS